MGIGIVVGMGEVGEALASVLKASHEVYCYDSKMDLVAGVLG